MRARCPAKEQNISEDWPRLCSYQEARDAHQAGAKLHVGDRIYLVRPALRAKEALVLWITDERTRGDHGWLLFPDGRVEAK